jgi:RNA polymerase sigma-70 factor, ECF subfamily
MDDEALTDALHRACAGDKTGFAALWRALNPAVLRYLTVVTGDAAEDVASETWLQATRDLHGFTGDLASFRRWLFRIARHRGIDERRRAGRRPTPADIPEPAAPDAATEALHGHQTAWALRMVGTLPPDQAEAVMLRVVIGLDVATTAHILGKRPGAVRIAAMRGLRRLAGHPQIRAQRDPQPAEEV